MSIKRTRRQKEAARKGFFAAVARLLGTGLGAGAGSLMYGIFGSGLQAMGVATAMAIVSFLLMWWSEYMREL